MINFNTLRFFVLFSLFLGLMACGGESTPAKKTEAQVATTTSTSQSTPPSTKPATSKKVIISGKDITVKSGEEFCVDVQVANFLNVVSMQYSTNYDSDVLEFLEIKNPALKDLSGKLGINFAQAPGEKNTIRFAWAVQDLQVVSLYDDSTIYQICFKAKGKSGTTTKIDFAEKPLAGEIAIKKGNSFVPTPAEFGGAKITIE